MQNLWVSKKNRGIKKKLKGVKKMENKNFIITNENVKEYVIEIAEWIKQKVEDAHAKGVVLGMSSGVDCSTVARLCQVAKVNTHLVLLPYGDNMKNLKNYDHAMELINKFNFDYHIFDIKQAIDAIQITGKPEFKNNPNKRLAEANLKPRMRMIYLYQYAQLNNFLVIGTSNLSERIVGYSTKWGDGASDFNPLGNLTKREVYVIAKYLEVPENIINKKPSADLWEGQNDEDEMGLTYEQIDNYILNKTSGNKKIDEEIDTKYKKNMHKLNPIPTFLPKTLAKP